MSRCRDLILSAALSGVLMTGPAWAGAYGLGRAASPDEIVAWDLDVRPDGTGLPEGQGSVVDGEVLFGDHCAACHGDFAEGVGNWPALSGGFDTLDHDDPVKTVGSYWPYLSTLWDYIHRSKPYGNAQSLEVNEVYAVVAFLLYSNDLVDEDFVLSQGNFLDMEMPNAGGFIIDDRPVAEYPLFAREPCMTECKGVVKVTARAGTLDVTPQSNASAGQGPAGKGTTVDPAILAAGEKAFRKCKSCHQIGDGAKNRIGPTLNSIVNAPAGAVKGFLYSEPMKQAAGAGLIWNKEALSEFLSNPKAYMKGTKMTFSGFKKQDEIEAVITYLSSFSG